MDDLLWKDFFGYPYDDNKVCYVNENDAPNYQYNHSDWKSHKRQQQKSK